MRFVYLIDEDADVRRSVNRLLRDQRDVVVRTFRTGGAFLEATDTLDPGVVLLELQRPGIDGAEILEALHQAGEGRFVAVLLTAVETVPLVVRAMKAGAADLVTKPYDAEALLTAIEAAFARLEAEQAELAVGETARDKINHLSARERDVLKGLVDGRPNKVIAGDLGISPRTVEIYRANVMRKLGVRSLAEAMRLVFAARWGQYESVRVQVEQADSRQAGVPDGPLGALQRSRSRLLLNGQGHLSIITPINMTTPPALTAHR
jgi:two-component system response regulator FixJ